jgi:hypothetical protein
VIKAYVDKERHNPPPKVAGKPKSDGKVEIGAVWTDPDPDGGKDHLQAGRFFIEKTAKKPVLATAAPGLQ